MASDRHENRMHGNPEMRGGHENRGVGGLSAWGHPEQGRAQTGYGNPARFDQHGGQTGDGWHSATQGGMGQGGGAMGGDYHSAPRSGSGYGYRGGDFGGQGGGSNRFGSRRDQGNARHFGDDAAFLNQGSDHEGRPGDFDEGRMAGYGGGPRPQDGFDRQRYGQQGLGSYGGRDHPQSWGEAQDAHPDHHDHQYRNWRDQQMQAFDREYDEFRRHRQERFNSEFEEWRKSRGGPGSAGGEEKR